MNQLNKFAQTYGSGELHNVLVLHGHHGGHHNPSASICHHLVGQDLGRGSILQILHDYSAARHIGLYPVTQQIIIHQGRSGNTMANGPFRKDGYNISHILHLYLKRLIQIGILVESSFMCNKSCLSLVNLTNIWIPFVGIGLHIRAWKPRRSFPRLWKRERTWRL